MKKIIRFLLMTLGTALVTAGCASCPVVESSCSTQTAASDRVESNSLQKEVVNKIPQTNDMKEVYTFIKAQKTYYLATTEGDQPRVRPFGTVHIFENKLYIQTGKKKNVAHQIEANPKFELVSYDNASVWLRLSGTLVEDDRVEAQASMLEEYPELKGMYTPGDGNTVVYYIKDATATISSFGAPDRTIQF